MTSRLERFRTALTQSERLKQDLTPLIQSKKWDAVVERLATENVIEAFETVYLGVELCICEAFAQEDLPLYVLDSFLKVCPGVVRQTGDRLIQSAIENNLSSEFVSLLIENHPEGLRDTRSITPPIYYALVRSTRTDVVSLLIEKYPEGPRTGDSFRILPIHEAARKASVEVVGRLIVAYPDGVKQKDMFESLPIHYAAETCTSLEIVNRLIEACPEGLQQVSKPYERLPIHVAARFGRSVEVIKRFIEAYPEGLRRSENGSQLPIHVAAQKRPADIVTAFIDSDPWGVRQRAYMGQLPIHYAAQSQGNVSVMKALIDSYPLSILLTSHHESSPLLPSEHAIVHNDSAEVVSYLENEEKKAIVELAHIVVGRQRKMEVTNNKV